jgi:hypothetical protein
VSRSILKPRTFHHLQPLLSNPLLKSLVARQPRLASRFQTHQMRPFSGTRKSPQATLSVGSGEGIMVAEITSTNFHSWLQKTREALWFPVGFGIGYIVVKWWKRKDENTRRRVWLRCINDIGRALTKLPRRGGRR